MTMYTTTQQIEKLALEKIKRRELQLLDEEFKRDWIHRTKEEQDEWLSDEKASIDAWFDQLDKTHRDQNTTGLGNIKPVYVEPTDRPFPRYFAMLGEEAAGKSMCDDIGALMIEIALIVSTQMMIGVSFGSYEAQQRTALRRLQKAAAKKTSTGTGTGTGSTAAATNTPPVQHAP